MQQHKAASKKPNSGCRLLGNAIRKHGWSNFCWKVIARVPVNQLDEREAEEIRQHRSMTPLGYNILSGGTLIPMQNENVRKKRAATMLLEGPRKRLSDSVKSARRNRPDWIESTTKARRERAERERAARMQGMTDAAKAQYLKSLEQKNRAANKRRATERQEISVPSSPGSKKHKDACDANNEDGYETDSSLENLWWCTGNRLPRSRGDDRRQSNRSDGPGPRGSESERRTNVSLL